MNEGYHALTSIEMPCVTRAATSKGNRRFNRSEMMDPTFWNTMATAIPMRLSKKICEMDKPLIVYQYTLKNEGVEPHVKSTSVYHLNTFNFFW